MAAISARVNFPLGLILPFAPDSKPSFTARVRAAADQSVGNPRILPLLPVFAAPALRQRLPQSNSSASKIFLLQISS